MTEVLGKNLHVAAWALVGTLPPDRMEEVLQGAVIRLGMNTNGMRAVVHQYPLNGKGGVGYTLHIPFGETSSGYSFLTRLRLWLARKILGRQRFASLVFQPLTESFIVADSYPELNRTYVLAASCLPLTYEQVVSRYLASRVGAILTSGRLEL
jgi:hypothetical protein